MWAKALIALASVSLTLLALEGALRLRAQDFFEGPPRRYRGLELELIGSGYPASYDEVLGYVPTPSTRGRENVWGKLVTIDADGFRSNGGSERPSGVPVLALGDSLTFGDEVDDDQTWPAHLERILGRPVVNGGVFGYGLDQIVLRAERITETLPTDLLIVSVIGDTIERCQFSYRYAAKPYFEVDDGGLALRNVPVPPPGSIAAGESSFERLARHSHLADFVMRRIDPQRWVIPETVRAHWDVALVSQRLVDRLQRLALEKDLRLLFVVQWVPGRDNVPAIQAANHAERRGIEVLRVYPGLIELVSGRLDHRALSRYFKILQPQPVLGGHMTAEGNEAVARLIAAGVLGL